MLPGQLEKGDILFGLQKQSVCETHGILGKSHFVDGSPRHYAICEIINLIFPGTTQIAVERKFDMHPSDGA